MTSTADIVKNLRDEQTIAETLPRWSCDRLQATMHAAADRIEALEGEVADAELRGERAYEYGKKRQAELIAALDAAEARAERLRVALEDIKRMSRHRLTYKCDAINQRASEALEDDKPIRAAAGGGE